MRMLTFLNKDFAVISDTESVPKLGSLELGMASSGVILGAHKKSSAVRVV